VFDRVVCINLDRRPDRWERLQKHLYEIRWPFPWPTRFAAVDGSAVPIPPDWDKITCKEGAFGCRESYRQILSKAVDEGLESVLILEDDAMFRPDFADLAGSFMRRCPDDWEGIYFGGQRIGTHLAEIDRTERPFVLRARHLNRTHCHALRGRWMVDALSAIEMSPGHVDHVWGPMIRDYTIYIPWPMLAGQAGGKSDVMGKVMPAAWFE
jgi:GR25 family glycosyltransferase involved in LPS biosynthesis